MKPEGGGGRGGSAGGGGNGPGGLPSRVEQWFYKHGLFLSSYPTCATSVAIVLLLFCCYPLLYVPLPGTIPTKIDLPYRGSGQEEKPPEPHNSWNGTSDRAAVFFGFHGHNLTFEPPPPPLPWGARQEPFVYVQQILFRVGVLPWTPDLILTDAYRGPFAEVFKLIEVVRNHQVSEDGGGPKQQQQQRRSLTLSDICLHVENVKVNQQQHQHHQPRPPPPPQQLFPEYNCLLLSPANFWHQNAAQFNKDATLLNTIFQQHNFQKTKISVAEMLLGMKIRDSGIKRYPLRSRTRVVQFAVTLVLTENHERFLQTLRDKLHDVYPLSKHSSRPGEREEALEFVTWIYYPGQFNSVEFVPLLVTLLLLFCYVYFFLKKMQLLRSRLVLAIAALLTILGSLVMSLGFCFFFGLTLSNQLKGILPYLVVLVGLENVLVITKCVLSTDETLDVKIRVARGLSREGWSIAKTLLTEITILTVGLATLVPFIQEFCIFAIVALISDFFLQMLLFSTILAMDIRPYNHHRAAISRGTRNGQNSVAGWRKATKKAKEEGEDDEDDDEDDAEGEECGEVANQFMRYSSSSMSSPSPPPPSTTMLMMMSRSQSHPRLSSMGEGVNASGAKDVVATRVVGGGGGAGGVDARGQKKRKKIPKRLKIVNFWARTRFFQRCFMIWMIVWISMIIYNSGVIESYLDIHGAGGGGVAEEEGKKSSAVDAVNSVPSSSTSSSGEREREVDETEQQFRRNPPPPPTTDPTERQQKEPQIRIPQAQFGGDFADQQQHHQQNRFNYTESLLRLRFPSEYETRDSLSAFHWAAILKRYNISVTGQFISILPSIRVSHLVTAEDVVKLRHPHEKTHKYNFQWKALAAALDPIDFSDGEGGGGGGSSSSSSSSAAAARRDVRRRGQYPQYPYGTPLYPSNPMELFFAAILICISVFVLTYTLVVMYRCICTRNYAEWRASWTDRDQVAEVGQGRRSKSQVQNVLQNSVPVSVRGHHRSAVECLASDGALVASSCLEGRIVVWDVTSGLRVSSIGGRQREGAQRRQQIWCLDFVDNLIAVGCSDGRLEFWEGSTGNEKCSVESVAKEEDGEGEHFENGVTHIKLIGDQVIVARLCGRVDFLKLESYNHGKQIDWGFTSAYRRTHIRTGSTGSLGHVNHNSGLPKGTIAGEELRCSVQAQHRGHHRQPVTCMEVTRHLLFVGGQDHTLKVFRLSSGTPTLLYTLHGHCGPITCLFIDQRDAPGSGGSGSQDGLLCLWELESGACVYGIQAHDGAVLSLVASPSYLISLGADERLCVWERFQGHLLNSVNITYAYSALLMLTPSLLLTSKPGALLVWDVRTGEPVKEVKLDCANSQLSAKMILPAAADCVVCDFGNELRIVRFPLVAEKVD